jgi:hypothetical protein
MMKAVNAKEFDMIASWSVDRLGRSPTDLLSILQGLHEKGVRAKNDGQTRWQRSLSIRRRVSSETGDR